ncbi:mas-related G-protein coupled receptor member X2-like [Chionomys nivalis]|uniref:mas-related G-protein coupled receptor member X2-like n=1 Tax=Chionomys nivalis TaxID=269649 RepID=UPI00259ABD6F|nr:mas-related G-protein coupled receptor member X2-like [Chionomys nivalis]
MYLSLFVLVGIAGYAIVLWLLGLHMHRNAFSVYILNLAVAEFLFLSFLSCQTLNYITASFLTLLVQIFCGSQWIPVTRLCVIIVLTVLLFLIFDLQFGIIFFLYQWFG